MGLRIRDIMTTQVVTLLGTDTVRDATICFAVDNVSGAPVVDEDYRLVGIISEIDILGLIVKYEKMLNRQGSASHILNVPMDKVNDEDEQLNAIVHEISETKVYEIMSKTVLTTSPDAKIMEVLKVMIDLDINRVPVLEKGVLVGIVTRGDIIFSIYKRKVRDD
ncbi:MAG: CBS domain-containing protein [Candidatus Methanomethylophilaceae archaeon]|jgi:CBS domain-containing protein|nr:CBS domain-containing protein [Candidatus Methanomethylophilaceae archaeon]